ncbi:MAG: NAD-dependent epimerase/dehydratase family protein [Bacillota bacterium]
MALNKTCLVTGAAGFVGSHLSRRLLKEGCQVIGIDCFTDYYDRSIKENNIKDMLKNSSFRLLRADITCIKQAGLEDEKIQWVFHQAAQAGVRASWGREFEHYTHHNVLGTQRLLEWARLINPERFIYASSSSVYGNTGKLPMHEDDLPRPLSPYGVTKLAAEHLCNLYYQNFGLPAVSLRYFTVYGPGQRPDMAFHRFIKAILAGDQVTIFGTGEQTRDFTYVNDIVEANLAAAKTDGIEGRLYNLGGGSRISVNGVLEILGRVSGREVKVKYEPVQAGDPPHTFADTQRAARDLNFSPQVSVEEGLELMLQSFNESPSQ